MRKINVINNVTLDGVMQAPGGKEEDTRDGFKHGGWAAPYNDEVKGKEMGEGMSKRGAPAVRPADVRGLLQGLARANGQPVHRSARQHAEVRRVDGR